MPERQFVLGFTDGTDAIVVRLPEGDIPMRVESRKGKRGVYSLEEDDLLNLLCLTPPELGAI